MKLLRGILLSILLASSSLGALTFFLPSVAAVPDRELPRNAFNATPLQTSRFPTYTSSVKFFSRFTYHYDVDDRHFNSRFIGLWLPTNLTFQEPLKAYYVPFMPHLALVKRGIDIRIVFLLAFAYLILLSYKFTNNRN